MRSRFYRMARIVQRWLAPVVDPFSVIRGIRALYLYPAFLVEYIRYRHQSGENVPVWDIYPCFDDRGSASQSGRGHYFYQDIWALARILERRPVRHVDVGSRIDGFSGQLSAFCAVEYVDIRPVQLGLENFDVIEGSLLQLPYPDRSVASLSCLHVIEHVGLGRYGDPVDPAGSGKAAAELTRILAPGGYLLVGIPIGQERVAFNAHRVFSPLTVTGWFPGLKLVEFSVVDDGGKFRRFAVPEEYGDADYACGLFLFERPA